MNKEDIRKKMEGIMDKRDVFFQLLKDFEDRYNLIPGEYIADMRLMNAYMEYKKLGGWRNNPKVKKRINEVIKIFFKNNK